MKYCSIFIIRWMTDARPRVLRHASWFFFLNRIEKPICLVLWCEIVFNYDNVWGMMQFLMISGNARNKISNRFGNTFYLHRITFTHYKEIINYWFSRAQWINTNMNKNKYDGISNQLFWSSFTKVFILYIPYMKTWKDTILLFNWTMMNLIRLNWNWVKR